MDCQWTEDGSEAYTNASKRCVEIDKTFLDLKQNSWTRRERGFFLDGCALGFNDGRAAYQALFKNTEYIEEAFEILEGIIRDFQGDLKMCGSVHNRNLTEILRRFRNTQADPASPINVIPSPDTNRNIKFESVTKSTTPPSETVKCKHCGNPERILLDECHHDDFFITHKFEPIPPADELHIEKIVDGGVNYCGDSEVQRRLNAPQILGELIACMKKFKSDIQKASPDAEKHYRICLDEYIQHTLTLLEKV
jgi:hypothetical protein